MDYSTRLLADLLVPNALWQAVAPAIPTPLGRPQGGGRGRRDDRTVFASIVLVVTTGLSWRAAGGAFGVPVSTVHRRFVEWSSLGLWSTLARPGRPLHPTLRSWLSAIAAAAEARRVQGDSSHDAGAAGGAVAGRWMPSTAGSSV